MKAHNLSKKASHQDWHPADIVAELHKRGITLRKLAAQHGVKGPSVVRALRERCLPSERRIAEALGVSPQTIWPTRYNADGTRKSPPKVTRPACGVNGNLRRAA